VGGKLTVVAAGKVRKFVSCVERITFSGGYAPTNAQDVLYVTERAVFRLGSNDLELMEIAPGIEIERDILPYMEFRPIMSE
jgi:propionate CoA-transferase